MEETNSQHLHFKIFKPYGYLSQFTNNDVSKHKKKLLGELYEFPENIMAIGRLDEKSEGLLLLTTDGKISDLINSSKIEKEYFAQVDGDITPEAIKKLKSGIEKYIFEISFSHITITGFEYFSISSTSHISLS